MYHRYQSDGNGQFTRRTVNPAPQNPAAPAEASVARPPSAAAPCAEQSAPVRMPFAQDCPPERQSTPGLPFKLPFLQKLLPNMDGGDLLLLLILLLLLSEGTEDATTAAMTIAIFLFLQ